MKKPCPKCGTEVREGQFYEKHVRRCEELPTAEEFIAMLDADVAVNVRVLAKDLSIGDERVKGIILQAGDERWTRETLKERGRLAKVDAGAKKRSRERRARGRKQCSHCELLIEEPEEELCKFCRMKAAGLTRWTDVQAMDLEDERWKIVRQPDVNPDTAAATPV